MSQTLLVPKAILDLESEDASYEIYFNIKNDDTYDKYDKFDNYDLVLSKSILISKVL